MNRNYPTSSSSYRQHSNVRTRCGAWQHDQRAETLDFSPLDNRPGADWFIRTDLMRTRRGVQEVLRYSMQKRWLTKEDVTDFARAIQDLGLGREA